MDKLARVSELQAAIFWPFAFMGKASILPANLQETKNLLLLLFAARTR
jgi:hypothetical protein